LQKQYPTGTHDPTAADIGANFYPEGGAYSSRDPAVLERHMLEAKLSGAGVLVVSWYPPGTADENGPPTDGMIPLLLDAAVQNQIKIALLIEPYRNQNVVNLRQNLEYVRRTYSNHPAFYKRRVGARELPVYYLYDSYRILPEQWRRLLSSKGDVSVRGTELDAVFLGLLVEYQHRADIKKSKFDGFFTYFAANGFTHGSSWKNWNSLSDYARRNSLLFVPSVGPGYVDTRVRPWNSQNTRERRKGSYYEMAWRTALNAKAKVVSVTSFNEWHEGTQIEPAVPRQTKDKKPYVYCSYEPEETDFYLRETRHWIESFVSKDEKKNSN
jgi:glycoprotein endo-alpha-1,2-mannosidase